MIIDFHTHIFPDRIAPVTIQKLSEKAQIPAYTDGTLDDLKRSMEASQVGISVVLPVVTRPDQFSSVNRFARKITPEEFTELCELAERKNLVYTEAIMMLHLSQRKIKEFAICSKIPFNDFF